MLEGRGADHNTWNTPCGLEWLGLLIQADDIRLFAQRVYQ